MKSVFIFGAGAKPGAAAEIESLADEATAMMHLLTDVPARRARSARRAYVDVLDAARLLRSHLGQAQPNPFYEDQTPWVQLRRGAENSLEQAANTLEVDVIEEHLMTYARFVERVRFSAPGLAAAFLNQDSDRTD